jgi:hypothetical protein
MNWLWLVTGASLLLALLAIAMTRGLSRRLAQLSEQYWELKFDHGELKARVKALAPTAEEQAATQPLVKETFVPLAGLKRSGLTSPGIPGQSDQGP